MTPAILGESVHDGKALSFPASLSIGGEVAEVSCIIPVPDGTRTLMMKKHTLSRRHRNIVLTRPQQQQSKEYNYIRKFHLQLLVVSEKRK